MSCYPPEVYRDAYDTPKPKPRTTQMRALERKPIVTYRRVTHAGYVEVTN